MTPSLAGNPLLPILTVYRKHILTVKLASCNLLLSADKLTVIPTPGCREYTIWPSRNNEKRVPSLLVDPICRPPPWHVLTLPICQ